MSSEERKKQAKNHVGVCRVGLYPYHSRMVAEGKNHPVSEMLIEGNKYPPALHGLVQDLIIFSFLHVEGTYTENIMPFRS